MGAMRKAKDLVNRCSTCKGVGQVVRFTEGADVRDRNGKFIGAMAQYTAYKTCLSCGGSGRR